MTRLPRDLVAGMYANRGIVGLGPPDDDQPFGWWPTHGYDGDMYQFQHNDDHSNVRSLEASGHTRTEWLALAEVMIERWQDFYNHIQDPTTV